MPEGSDHRLQLTLEENRMLREQLAEVQRAFEQHALDTRPDDTPGIPRAGLSRKISLDGSRTPSRLLRYVRHRVASPARVGEGESHRWSGQTTTGRSSEPTDKTTKRREWARLRAQLDLAEEKSANGTAQVQRAQARLDQLRDEHAQCGKRLRAESERFAKSVEALNASQQLVRHLERFIASMEAWLAGAASEKAQFHERLEKIQRSLDSERSLRLTAEEARRKDASRLGEVREKLQTTEQELEAERNSRRAEEKARRKVTESLTDARKRLQEIEEELESERKSRRTADLARSEAIESLESARDRLQRVSRERESERDARRAAEQARILDAENLSELRERFAKMVDELSDRDRMIERLGEHIDAAWASAQRLMSDSDSSAASWSELSNALRESVEHLDRNEE